MILFTNCKTKFEIDDEDYFKILKHNNNFFISGRRKNEIYIYSKILKTTVKLCRLILNCPFDNGKDVDHWDGNNFNNKKRNLRWSTFSQNHANKTKTKNKTTSIYKGVVFNKKSKKFIAHITINRVNKHLGCFISEVEAAVAYDDAAILIFGEFAKLNFQLYGA